MMRFVVKQVEQLRAYLRERGVALLYGLFVAGYFLLPMAAGHRRVYYAAVFPAVALLGRELWRFYRGNPLAGLTLAYAGWTALSIAWTENFSAAAAAWALWCIAAVLSFVFITGYLWAEQPRRAEWFLPKIIALAGFMAALSILAWYGCSPFPTRFENSWFGDVIAGWFKCRDFANSRLEPLGVMHHPIEASCAYGLFLVLALSRGPALGSIFRGRACSWRTWLGCVGHVSVVFAMLALVLLSQSRTPLAALCVAFAVLLGWRSLCWIVPCAAVNWWLIIGSPASYRLETFSFRPGIWESVVRGMSDDWLIGKGLLSDVHVTAYGNGLFHHAHNAYLAALRDGGAVGLALLMGILALALVQAWRLLRERGERLYLALLLYGMTCVFADFDRLFTHPQELWLFFWLPIALMMAAWRGRRGVLHSTGVSKATGGS